MSNDNGQMLEFSRLSLADLERFDDSDRDALPFGVIGLTAAGIVEVYSETESRLAGISRESVLGSHYFSTTAQCMNNFMVAQRFEDEATLDVILDYVLTLRMRPTPVKLRLLKGNDSPLDYIFIQRL